MLKRDRPFGGVERTFVNGLNRAINNSVHSDWQKTLQIKYYIIKNVQRKSNNLSDGGAGAPGDHKLAASRTACNARRNCLRSEPAPLAASIKMRSQPAARSCSIGPAGFVRSC
jgi:hypothetical protein